MAEEGILIPGEPAEVENRARGTGWISKEEFDADPGNEGKKWRPADEYLERGELFNTMKSLRGELTSLKKDFNSLAQHHKEVAQVEFRRAIETLKAQRTLAAEEGDTLAVVQYSDKIEELKDSHKVQQEQNRPQGGVHPLFPIWIEENPQYVSDPKFKADADALASSYIMQHPGSPFEDVLTYVNQKIQTKYPKEGTRRPATSSVEGGTVGIPKKANGKFTKADLSDEEREVMRAFVKRGVLTEDEYITELGKRKGV
jgi:hypothetical protein